MPERNLNQWCLTWIENKPKVAGAERAALVKGVKWAPGETITVSFLDGDPGVQEKVMQAARRWTVPGMANLKLDFRAGPETDIRISFRFRGSWSVLGKSCRTITDLT